MFRLLLTLFALTPALAYAEEDGLSYPQTADRYVIKAEGAKNGDIIVTLNALPIMNACGKLSPIDLEAGFDAGFADIYIGDYSFTLPLGTGPRDCGPVNKMASGTVTLPAEDLQDYQVTMLRIWSGENIDILDTYYFTRAGTKVFLNAPHPPTRVFLP
jgi:hypothetical protein